jgi:hypothetical protein
MTLERKPPDVDTVEHLSQRLLSGLPETYELDVHALVDERFGRPSWPGVGRVIGEQEDGGAPSTQGGTGRARAAPRSPGDG